MSRATDIYKLLAEGAPSRGPKAVNKRAADAYSLLLADVDTRSQDAVRQQLPYDKRAPLQQPGDPVERLAVDPVKKWAMQIDAMLSNENPEVRKEGAALLQKQYSASLSGTTDGRTTDIKNYQFGLKNPAFNKWRKGNKTDMYEKSRNKVVSSSDALKMKTKKGVPAKIAPDMTYGEAAEKGYWFSQLPTAEEAKAKGSFAVSLDMLNRLDYLNRNGLADISGFGGLIEDLRGQGTIGGAASDMFLNFIGYEAREEDVEAIALSTSLGNQILAAFRGAAVGPDEKADFIKQLPIPGQSPEIYAENLKLTRRNLATMAEKANAARGQGSSSTPSAPPSRYLTQENVDTYSKKMPNVGDTYDAGDGYIYRKAQDGSYERMKSGGSK